MKIGRITLSNSSVTLFLGILFFIPWLGMMYFYSKGEPREAVVAVSMLDSGNWILPVSYGDDIPYKPPFLAWLIALFSLLFNGGHVNEFVSRLPSALAAIVLLVMTYRVLVSRVGMFKSLVVTALTATFFEFYRAAVACRVDMLLTMFMVGAIYLMFEMHARKSRLVWAILFLSGATLTKGPVGSLLPCLAIGIYELTCGKNFIRTSVKMLTLVLCSWLIPALWYYAAFKQGGWDFAHLAWEENIGRLTGTMGYESHLKPWYYNIITLISGVLPWTVPALGALCFKTVRKELKLNLKNLLSRRSSFGKMALVVFLTVFVFYCIPSSKRSVYLLPCYPFIAYWLMCVFVSARHTVLLYLWNVFLVIISLLVPIAIVVMQFITPQDLQLGTLSWVQWIMIWTPPACVILCRRVRKVRASALLKAMILTYGLYFCYTSSVAPVVMNGRSDVVVARYISSIVDDRTPIYSNIQSDSLLRYYSINFYLDDRLRTFKDTLPSHALLLTDVETPGAQLISARSADTRSSIYMIRHDE
ncbi:MAG: glycosyltransferase family 39 protein [Muribaculaceae bacterium]|nr:glycosyltransferase family 39 protein [Muribaculaceae bacterium]